VQSEAERGGKNLTCCVCGITNTITITTRKETVSSYQAMQLLSFFFEGLGWCKVVQRILRGFRDRARGCGKSRGGACF